MPRDEKRPRSRSRERHRDRIDPTGRERKCVYRDDAVYDRENGYRTRDELYKHDRDYDDRDDRLRREQERRRRHERREERRRSRSFSRSRSSSPKAVPANSIPDTATEKDTQESDEPLTEEQQEMMRVLGFCNFNTTKGKHVIGNSVYVANISKQRKYRQYMNRRGGFNRPLDRVA